MVESGLVEHWKEKLLSLRSHCGHLNVATHAPPRSLTMTDLFSAFIVLLIGMGLALLAFIAENMVHKIAKSNI